MISSQELALVLLYTDDERLRSLARSEFKVNGVWTSFADEMLKRRDARPGQIR